MHWWSWFRLQFLWMRNVLLFLKKTLSWNPRSCQHPRRAWPSRIPTRSSWPSSINLRPKQRTKWSRCLPRKGRPPAVPPPAPPPVSVRLRTASKRAKLEQFRLLLYFDFKTIFYPQRRLQTGKPSGQSMVEASPVLKSGPPRNYGRTRSTTYPTGSKADYPKSDGADGDFK